MLRVIKTSLTLLIQLALKLDFTPLQFERRPLQWHTRVLRQAVKLEELDEG